MSIDWLRLDRELVDALRAWRRGAAAIGDSLEAGIEPACPLPDRLVRGERIAEVEELDEPFASRFGAWLRALAAERRVWQDRVELARRWRARVPALDEELALVELRRRMLAEREPRRREALGKALAAHLGWASDGHIATLERRIESGDDLLHVAGADGRALPALAADLIERTQDMAEELGTGWVERLHGALGRDAAEGWPAKLGARWIEEVFAPELTGGLSIALPRLPPPRGAISFARALGLFGIALLEATRPTTLPWPLHQLPQGTRRHQRRALFAAVVAEPVFALRVLGLGRARARDQARRTATALLAALRIDALRVVLLGALPDGKSALAERFAETTEAMFGAPAPASLCAALPQLRSGDAAAVAGSLLALEEHDALVARHEEDWFRNPRAAAEIREADAAAGDGEPIEGQRLAALLDALVTRFERALG
jgi:hypothetical protein